MFGYLLQSNWQLPQPTFWIQLFKNMNDKTQTNKKGAANPAMTQLPQENIWHSLYAITQHWKSDLIFFEDELNFFRLLIDKHLSLLIDQKNIDQTRLMVSHVIGLENERTVLLKRVETHVGHIADLVENPFAQNAQEDRREHERLAPEFASFVKSFRKVKTEVFKITEKVIHSEKVKKIIDWA
jgi:hypothetical protein